MKKIMPLLCAFLAVLFFIPPLVQKKPSSEPPYKRKEECSLAKNLLELHNKERVKRGYKPIEINESLCEYAQKHAEKMAKEQRLRHSKMSDLQKVNKSGYVGENIAWGQKDEDDAISAWMWSPMHRSNILGTSYKKAGFGAAKDEDGRYYWCAVFSD